MEGKTSLCYPVSAFEIIYCINLETNSSSVFDSFSEVSCVLYSSLSPSKEIFSYQKNMVYSEAMEFYSRQENYKNAKISLFKKDAEN